MDNFIRYDAVEKTGIIAGLFGLLGAVVHNREAIRKAIISARIKEGSEIRLMTKRMSELSEEKLYSDVELAKIRIENINLREELRILKDKGVHS